MKIDAIVYFDYHHMSDGCKYFINSEQNREEIFRYLVEECLVEKEEASQILNQESYYDDDQFFIFGISLEQNWNN